VSCKQKSAQTGKEFQHHCKSCWSKKKHLLQRQRNRHHLLQSLQISCKKPAPPPEPKKSTPPQEAKKPIPPPAREEPIQRQLPKNWSGKETWSGAEKTLKTPKTLKTMKTLNKDEYVAVKEDAEDAEDTEDAKDDEYVAEKTLETPDVAKKATESSMYKLRRMNCKLDLLEGRKLNGK